MRTVVHSFGKHRALLLLLLLCAVLLLVPAPEQMAQFPQPVPSPSDLASRFKRKHSIDTEPGSVNQISYPTSPIERNSQESRIHPSGFPLSLSQASINFGPQLVGTTSAQQVETLSNSGQTALTIIELEISGGDRADFSLSQDFTLPVTLAPGSSVAVNLNFSPSAPWRPGSRDARLKTKWSGGNEIVPLTGMGVTCAGAVPAAESGGVCADTDGDGFNDVWEDHDYIDLNNNGREDDEDFHFPHRRSHIFSAVARNGSGAGRIFPTVIDPKLRIGTSTVVVTVASGGPVGTATFTYSVDGGDAVDPLSTRPVKDLHDNLRLMFYDTGEPGDPSFVAGETYTFTTAMGRTMKLADKNVPNIYVQYDYMGFSSPGDPCSQDDDCNAGGNQLNNVCHKGFCNHNHAPGDPLFRKVVDQFAAHGITLYIDPNHEAVPHAQVITWAKPGDMGATAACAGANVVAGNIGPGQLAVNFHDVKYRPGSDFAAQPERKNIYHYTVFSHSNTCLHSVPGLDGYCGACGSLDRSPNPGALVSPGASGLAELPGNDFMMSLGGYFSNPSASTPRDPYSEGGVFMHELGHNIGLHHHGDSGAPSAAPNYLSVMNYNYIFGIQHAANPGGVEAVEDLRELNYSEHELNNLNELALDESAGVSPISSGYTGILLYFKTGGGFTFGPEAGSIDWNGNGLIDPGFVIVDIDSVSGATETLNGYADWVHGPCTSSTDCRINGIRDQWRRVDDPALDPHEPCVQGRCQSLWFPFQGTRWGKAD